MLGENMKDINLDCRKQTSAASMAGHLFEMKQLVLNLSTSRAEIQTKIYANLGCKKRWKIKIIIFQQLFFELLELIFLNVNILLPAKSS